MDNPCKYCIHKPCQLVGVICQQKKYFNKMRMFFDTERARLLRKKYSQKQEVECFEKKDDHAEHINITMQWFRSLSEDQKNKLNSFKG